MIHRNRHSLELWVSVYAKTYGFRVVLLQEARCYLVVTKNIIIITIIMPGDKMKRLSLLNSFQILIWSSVWSINLVYEVQSADLEFRHQWRSCDIDSVCWLFFTDEEERSVLKRWIHTPVTILQSLSFHSQTDRGSRDIICAYSYSFVIWSYFSSFFLSLFLNVLLSLHFVLLKSLGTIVNWDRLQVCEWMIAS